MENMKPTGIIRRIDDLGRVVIPKEIRNTLHICEGDPMEIFVHNNMVCFAKYSPLHNNTEIVRVAKEMARKIYLDVAIYDSSKILDGPTEYPSNVQNSWMEIPVEKNYYDNANYDNDNKVYVYPVSVKGSTEAYVVSKTGDSRIYMITNYIAVALGLL